MPGPWPDLYSLHSLAKDIKSVLFSYYNILQIISLNHFVQRKPLMSKEWSNGRMYIAHGNDHLRKKNFKQIYLNTAIPYTTQPPPKVQIGNSLMHIKLVPTLFLTLLLSSTKPAVDFKQY